MNSFNMPCSYARSRMEFKKSIEELKVPGLRLIDQRSKAHELDRNAAGQVLDVL